MGLVAVAGLAASGGGLASAGDALDAVAPLAPWPIALALVLGLIVLVPARRLQLAGFSGRVIGAYALLLWVLGMVAALGAGGARALIPMLLVAYVAPFVAAPATLARVMRQPRPGGGPPHPPIKDVTPRDGEAGPSGDGGPTGGS